MAMRCHPAIGSTQDDQTIRGFLPFLKPQSEPNHHFVSETWGWIFMVKTGSSWIKHWISLLILFGGDHRRDVINFSLSDFSLQIFSPQIVLWVESFMLQKLIKNGLLSTYYLPVTTLGNL